MESVEPLITLAVEHLAALIPSQAVAQLLRRVRRLQILLSEHRPLGLDMMTTEDAGRRGHTDLVILLRELGDLLRDPTRIEEVPADRVPALLSLLATFQTALAARLLTTESSDNDQTHPLSENEQLLTAEETAQKLGVSVDWLYRHAAKLPFAVRVGSRHLRFSSRGIDRYIRTRTGR